MEDGTAVHVSTLFSVNGADSREDFHAHGRQVMDALLDLEQCNDDITDSTVSTDAGVRQVLIEMLVLVSSEAEAVRKASDIMRTAIHTAGGSTPFWEDPGPESAAAEYNDPHFRTERALLRA